ncbi:Oligoribonuclease [Yarrowia sp. C11]|nr:Oligoribonuclease [Yarrowia sp. E02]KAG5369741.1 Oligoribonuclease [Yarrowia sp. C11]
MEPPLVWIDCEMTGLDQKNDVIIEICCLITNGSLKVLDKTGYESVVHCSKSKLDAMSPWCVKHHGASGLTKRCLESPKTMKQVETELLEYLKRHVRPKKGIVAGNCIHQDKIFLAKDMPRVHAYLHFRIIDVSSIKEVMKRHNPKMVKRMPYKQNKHTARSDIEESIGELKWYYKNYLRR